MKIIVQKRSYGWAAWFYGFERMPEDVELPLTFTADAPLVTVAADMRRRFPGARLMYRDTLDHVSQVVS